MPNVFNPNKLIQNDLLKTANNQKKGQTALSSNTQKSTVNPLQLSWNTPKAAKQTATVTDYGNDSLNEKYRSTVKMLYNLQQKTGSSFNVIDDAKGLMNAYIGTVKASYGLNSGRSAGEYLKIGQNEFDRQLQDMVFKYQHANDTPEQMETFLNNKGYLGVKNTQAKSAQNVIGAAKALGAGANPLSNINLEEIGDYVASYGAGNLSAEEKAAWESVPAQLRQQYVTDAHNAKKNPAYGQALRDWAAQQGKAAQNITLEEAEQYLAGQGWQYGFAKAHPGDLAGWMDAFSRAGDIVNRAMINGVDKLNANDKEVYYYLQGNNGPEMGAGLLGMGNMTNQELASYNVWGQQKAQELAAANGLYTQEQMDPETRFVRDQWRQTPEGAKQWAQDAVGTEEEQEAKQNEWFVTKRAKFDEVPSMGKFEVYSEADPDFYSGNADLDMKYRVINGLSLPDTVEGTRTYGTLTIADEKQKKIFNALANDGKYEDALEYLDFISYDLNERAVSNMQQNAYDLGNNGFWGGLAASALSVPASLTRGVGALDIAVQNLQNQFGDYRPIDYSRAQTSGVIADAARQGVQDQVNWEMNVLGQDVDLFDFLYGTAMSGVDSLAAGAMGGWPGAAVLGLGAAQNTMMDLQQQGGNDRQVMIGGALAGAFETLFEHISIGQFYDEAKHLGKRNFGEHMKNILAQAGINFSEEFNTELFDMIAEESVMGSKAQTAKQRQEYIDLGLTEQEADARIAQEKALRLLEAGFGGALMGGAFGGISNISSDVNTSRYETKAGKIFDAESKGTLKSLGGSMPDGEAKGLARKYDPEKATDRETGALVRAIMQELPQQAQGSFRETFVMGLLNSLEDMSPDAAEAIADMMSGRQLAPEQIDALAKDQAGMRAVYDLLGVNGETGRAMQKRQTETAQAETAPALEELAPMPGTREPVIIKAPERAGRAQNAGKGTITVGEKQNEAEWQADWQADGSAGNVRPSEQSQEARRNVEPVKKVAGDDMLKAPKEPILYTGKDQGPRRNVKPVEKVAGDDMLKAADNTETQSEGTETTGKAAPLEKRQGIMGFSVEKESGGAVARMEDGSEQDVDSLDIPDAQKALAQEAADLPAEAQGVILRHYEGQDAVDYAQRYAKGMKTVYNAAKNGRTLEDTRSLYAEDLTEGQRKAAWEAGRAEYEKEEQRALDDTRRNRDQAKADGYNFKVLEQEDAEQQHKGVYLARVRNAMTRNQEIQLAVLEDVMNRKGLPVQIRVYDTLGDKNGSYQAGSNIVNVALDAEGGLINRTVSHELYHFVKEWNQEAAGKLQSFVIDTLNGTETFDLDKRRQDIAQQYRDRAGQELTADAIDEEIAAESMLDAIDTQENLQAFYKNADKSLIEKITSWIKDTVAKIRDAMARIGRNHPEVEAMRGNMAALEKIQADLITAAQTAGRNYQAARTGMNSQAAQDTDVMAYQEEMGKAVTPEAAQEARNGLESALFARYYADMGGDLGGLEYEDAFQRFQAAMEVFGSGESRSLAWAFNQAKIPVPKQGMNSVLSYAARQMAAGAREAASVKNELKAEEEKLPSSIIKIEDYQTPEQQKQVVDYLGAVDSRMLEAAKEYKENRNAEFKRLSVLDVSEREAADIERLTGYDVSGYVHEADKNFFIHTENRHGENGAADQSMADLNDVARVAWVLKNYDSVEWNGRVSKGYSDKDGNPMPLLEYKKQINGSIYIVEAVGENKWGKLHLITARIQKNHSAGNTQNGTVTQASNVTSPELYVRNELASPANDSLANGDRNVNGKFSLKADTEYMLAAERGDEEAAQRMVDEAAEKSMAESKIRDEEGRLMPVYHGTSERFTSFDMSKGRANMDIQGAFFSPWELDAEGYGENVGRYYLDIKNPADEQTGYKALRKFQGQNEAGRKAREYLISQGYDGVNNEDQEFIAFYPEQIKLADAITYDDAGNVIPLSERFNEENPDIRYSFKAEEADAERQALEDVREDADLYSQMQQDEDARAALLMLRQLHTLTTQGGADALIKPGAFEKRLSDIVSKIEEETGTKYGHNKLMAALRKVYKAMEQRDYNLGEILQYTRGIMQDVLEKAPGVLVEQDEATREVIRILKTRPFYLSAEQKSEVAGTYGALGDYMRKNFGKMRIRKQSPTTASLADVWREDLAPILPGTFAEDTSELDMPGILDAWLENANKKKFAGEFGANIGAYATNQALNAMLDFYDVPGALKTKEEIRQGFQERFNEQRAQINQLKETARGAVDQARLQYEERYRNRIEKDQARKDETERKQKLRGQITRDVKAINTLNTSMTDTRHVPESMRAAALAAVEPFISNSGVFSGAAQIRLAHEYELLKQRAGEIGGFDEDILETINGLGERLNGRRLSQLTEQELQDLADITGNLRKIIADTNEAFVNGRKTTIDALSARLKQDMRNKGPARKGKAAEAARALSYRETTPTYFADRVGGVIRDMIRDLYAGQNTWAFTMHNAKEFLGEDGRKKSGVMGKYHVNDWINDKQHARFTTQHGDMIELNRQEALSLYALWKRETSNKLQNANHLRVGGFMYDKGTRYEGVDTMRPHPLTESDMKMIRDYLTEEQKAFADEMVKYLSEDMAKIGNETSMRLYGYEKFKENYYFPYDTDRRYLVGDLTQNGEQVKQPKSAGMTKALMQNAATPITVKPFTEVWANHVNQMGLYAGFAETIDTMSRVFNQRESGQMIMDANGEEFVISPESNWIEMEKALGAEGVQYLKTLVRDVSGGVRADERGVFRQGLSLFKKGSVAGNLSVVLQQPTAYARAMMMVNPKYLMSANPAKLPENIRNMYKYSGVALIKNMGRFDTGTGKGAVAWMQDKITEDSKLQRVLDKTDKWTGMGAEKADEWTWGILWGAIERETQHTRPDLTAGTEEFYQAVAERFEDVVNHTQVYDSVLSKSEWMRSNTLYDKMATSFMAEPTLTLNMLQDAIVNFRQNGGGKKVARAAATFLVNSALVAIAKSIVTATRRKDDEGRTWLEKYLAEAAGNFADDVSPYGLIGMIPWARDAVSLLEGYNVERSDMDAMEQLKLGYDSVKKYLEGGNITLEDTLQNTVGGVANLMGVPMKNLWRDMEDILRNLFGGASANEPTTRRDVLYSVMDKTGLAIPFTGNGFGAWDSSRAAYYDRMEEALKAGDMDRYNELRGYVEETLGVKAKTVTSGIRNAIQESVKEGRIEDDQAIELLKLLDGDDADEIDAYFQIKEWKQEKAHEDDEEYSYSRFEDVYAAVKAGQSIAQASKDLLAHEYTQDDIDSKILSQIGDWYKKGEMSKEEATRKLKQYNGMDDADDLYFQFQKWEYEKTKGKRDPAYSRYMKVYDAVDTDASATAAIKELTSHGYSDESVKSSIKNHIGEMYREGDITKAQATARLRKYAGVTDSDDLHWVFDEWDYNTAKGKKDPDYSRFIDVFNAVDKGQSISTAMREMTQNGYDEKDVKSKIKSHIGDQYREGTLSKSKAESKLKQYTGITDSNDLYWVFDEWDYKKKNANNKNAPDYSRYLVYDNAVKNGSKLTEETNRLLSHGVEKDTISKHITSTFKPEYVALVKAGRTKEAEDLKYRLLTAYERAGYDRTKKNKDIAAWLKEKKQ